MLGGLGGLTDGLGLDGTTRQLNNYLSGSGYGGSGSGSGGGLLASIDHFFGLDGSGSGSGYGSGYGSGSGTGVGRGPCLSPHLIIHN